MKRQYVVKENQWSKRKYFVEARENGKRTRKFFQTKPEAQEYANLKNIELENFGRGFVEFDSRLRDMAQDCATRLLPFKKTIADATNYFVAHLKAVNDSCKVAELVDAVLVARAKACGRGERPASKSYIGDLRVRLRRFSKAFGERLVAEITTKEIKDWIGGLTDEKTGEPLSPVSRGNYGRAVNVLFSYAVEQNFATSNPALAIKKPAIGDGEIGILTPAQAARLLESSTPEARPHLAIGLFAGLRRAELQRLDWSEVKFDSGLIEVTAKKAKTAARRFVKIQPNLDAWLRPFRQPFGKVTPKNFPRHLEKARYGAGIMDWPSNCLRHSFASYHLAHFRQQNELALEMGHTSADMLFAHYRELVTPSDAEKYWNIKPAPATTEKIVSITA